MPNWTGFNAVRAGLGASLRRDENQRYVNTVFRSQPVLRNSDGSGESAVTDNAVNTLMVDGYSFQYILDGAFTTDPPITVDNTGLLITPDATANEGFELNLGNVQSDGSTLWTNSRGHFVSQTDEFFIRVVMTITDVSDYDVLCVGVRGSQAYVDDPIVAAGYDDFYCLNVDLGDIQIVSELNNSGSISTTDTTDNWADGESHTLEIRVAANGNARAFIDDANPTVNVTGFTFDSGDVLLPFIGAQLDAGVSAGPTVIIEEWESGLVSSRGLANIFDRDEAGATAFS